VKINNRQIGRPMEYPFDAPPPKKQVAWIFDTNKCIDCQTCTVACKTCWTSGKGQETTFFNNVETKPYGGYPVGWDTRLMEQTGPAKWQGEKLVSLTVFETDPNPLKPPLGHRPQPEDYASPNLGEDDIAGLAELGAYFNTDSPPMWMFYLARICNHCTLPACAAACPRRAIYKREEDGVVLVDQSRCRGYQECVRACPYKKVFFNVIGRISEKCIACYPRLEEGLVSLCTESCIGKIRLNGFLSTGEPREDNPLDYIVHFRKLALPLYPQHGTSPNVYYIPPIHVPNAFLEQLFGPGVQQAKDIYRSLPDDPRLLGALLLFGASSRIIERYEVRGEEAIGFDRDDVEVARVPFTEPVYVREHYDAKHDVYRHNTT